MFKIGVLVSGGGTNLQAIINNIENGTIKEAQIVTVISNVPDVYALERAKKHGIYNVVIDSSKFKEKIEYEKEVIKELDSKEVDLIVLAGYMKILSKEFVEKYKNKIINIHPSLIPSFCGKGMYGLKPHKAALERGVKITGATVHYVTEGTDEGPIIIQKAVEVLQGDTPEILQKRVMEQAEWKIYSEAINIVMKGGFNNMGKVSNCDCGSHCEPNANVVQGNPHNPKCTCKNCTCGEYCVCGFSTEELRAKVAELGRIIDELKK